MIAIGLLFVRMLCDCFKSRRGLEAEILVLRHQLNVLQQRAPRRLHLRWADRALFIWLYRRCPRILDAITIVRPETVVRWHRMGFAAYWRWKSRPLGGRPRIGKEVRDLIRRMSFENPLWGAPKIHGELLKLGIDVAQSTVSIYMVPRRDRPLQTWKTFLRNHVEGIASIDLFVVPTIAFQQLFAFLVLGHRRRQLLWFAVTRNPTAEWLARQITEAFPWDRLEWKGGPWPDDVGLEGRQVFLRPPRAPALMGPNEPFAPPCIRHLWPPRATGTVFPPGSWLLTAPRCATVPARWSVHGVVHHFSSCPATVVQGLECVVSASPSSPSCGTNSSGEKPCGQEPDLTRPSASSA
jgi:hypothetical protein